MKNLSFLILLIFIGIGCDEEPINIPPFEGIISDRVIFIEDLTGVKCPNCPKGTAKLEALRQLYPINFVTVGIHGGFLTDPLPESKYDFKNSDAEALESKLEWIAKPSAVFNRIKFEDQDFQGIDNVDFWQEYLERLMQEEHEVNLSFVTTFNATDGTLRVDITATPLVTKSGDFRVTLMLVENEIEDAQEYPDRIEEDYVHDHVMRKLMTNLDGDAISTEMVAGQELTKSITITLPETLDGSWDPVHMDVVGFISQNIDSKDIAMQGAKAKLM